MFEEEAKFLGILAEAKFGKTSQDTCNPHMIMKGGEQCLIESLSVIWVSRPVDLASGIVFHLHSVKL